MSLDVFSLHVHFEVFAIFSYCLHFAKFVYMLKRLQRLKQELQKSRAGTWAGIFKPLWSPGIDAKPSIPPAYVAWRAGTINPIPTRCLAPKDFLKIPAQSRKFKSRYGARIDSRNRVWNWVAKLHRLAGQYDNPMPTWILAPIPGLSYRHRQTDGKN